MNRDLTPSASLVPLTQGDNIGREQGIGSMGGEIIDNRL